MRVLGIDPGIATVGFGIIESLGGRQDLINYGIVKTPAKTSLSSRLDLIYEDIIDIIKTFSPDVIAIEELFFNTNISTGISVAHGRGRNPVGRAIDREFRYLSIRRSR